jgi:outer membrane protein TolC
MRFRSHSLIRIAAVLVLFAATATAEPIPFKRAIELALKHSGTMAIAIAEQTRTHQTYLAQRDQYLPSVVFGSGLGYSWGIPLTILGSAPSIFNVNTSQDLYNPAHRANANAAKVEWKASDLDLLDRKNGVILDTATFYTQLDSVTAKLNILRKAKLDAQHAQFITSERIKEGIDSELDLKKSQLVTARIQLQIADAEGQADVLRERLSKLIGIPAESIETVTESVPLAPDLPQDNQLAAQAAESNPAVRLAFEHAKAAEMRADAEHKALLPSIDFGSQYAMLAKYNNYETFYNKYERNNYTIGVNIRFPFVNPSQRAAAHAADADAVKFRKQAEIARNNVQAETLRIQRSLVQLAAARDVAKLEYEVAQADIETVHAKIVSGQGTSRDEEQARIDANAKYAAYLDANYNLVSAQMQMLRMTGKIQEWALGDK